MTSQQDAYKARMKRNNDKLMVWATQAKLRGCKVLFNRITEETGMGHHSMVILKDDKLTRVGFAEVPYRWYAGSDEFNEKALAFDLDDPFDIDHILTTLYKNELDKRFMNMYIEL